MQTAYNMSSKYFSVCDDSHFIYMHKIFLWRIFLASSTSVFIDDTTNTHESEWLFDDEIQLRK